MTNDDFKFYWEEGRKPEGKEITVKLPGYKKNKIKVSIGGGFLKISAEKKGKRVEKGKGFYKEESFQHAFRKSISLPDDAKPEELEISISDGSVRLKKKKHAEAK